MRKCESKNPPTFWKPTHYSYNQTVVRVGTRKIPREKTLKLQSTFTKTFLFPAKVFQFKKRKRNKQLPSQKKNFFLKLPLYGFHGVGSICAKERGSSINHLFNFLKNQQHVLTEHTGERSPLPNFLVCWGFLNHEDMLWGHQKKTLYKPSLKWSFLCFWIKKAKNKKYP